jgi:hypothetical protein
MNQRTKPAGSSISNTTIASGQMPPSIAVRVAVKGLFIRPRR